MAISKLQIVRALGKARMAKGSEIDIDQGVIDLQLKEPYACTSYCETCWIFDYDWHGTYTNKMILDDLLCWFSSVEESPDYWE